MRQICVPKDKINSVMNEKVEGHCLECGDAIDYGRKDKKFCSSSCKNKYHNEAIKRQRWSREKTLRRIDKNHSILSSLLKCGMREIEINAVVALGFRPEYVTFFKKNRKSIDLRCFDIKYKQSEERIYHITKVNDLTSEND